MAIPEIDYLTVLESRNLKWVSLGQIQGVSRAVFLSGGSRGESVFLPVPNSRGGPHPLACGPLPSSKPARASLRPLLLSSHLPSLALTLLPPSFTYKDTWDYIQPTQTIQNSLPISRSSIYTTETNTTLFINYTPVLNKN